MKKLIPTIVLLFSFTTQAESLVRLEGLFEYASLSVSQVRDYEVVPMQNKNRIETLLNNGYECKLISEFYKCKKFLKDIGMPGSLAAKINASWENSKVIFKKSATDPMLVNDSEAIQEWDVFDSVAINQERAEMYRHWVMNGDLHKLKIETQNTVYYPLLLNEKQISFPTETTVTSGRFNWKTYNVDVIFRKTP